MSSWTKKVMFVGLPRYFEQLLAACFRKEGWEVCRLRGAAEEKPPQGIQTYDCAPESEGAEAVFAVQNLDLLVHRLERDPAHAMERLDVLLRLARQSKMRRVFLLSGSDVFAPGTAPVETDVPSPQTEEGLLLARLETVGNVYREQGLPVSILRMAELYAPGQTSDDGFVGRLFGASLMGRALPQYDDPARVSYGLLDARDAVYGVYQAAVRNFEGAYLHVAAPHGTTMEEFYRICGAFFPSMRMGAKPRAPQGHAVLHSAIIERDLGWRPRRPLAEGLKETYEAMQAARDAYVTDIRALSRKARL